MVETVQSLSGYADKVPSLFVFHENKAASYVLRGINVFELRMADDRCFPGEIDQMRVVLGRIGLTVSNGKVIF